MNLSSTNKYLSKTFIFIILATLAATTWASKNISVGQEMPKIIGKNISIGKIFISGKSTTGQVYLFFKINCENCSDLLENFATQQQNNSRIELYTVHSGFAHQNSGRVTTQQLAEYTSNLANSPDNIIWSPPSLHNKLGLTSYPALVFVDSDNVVLEIVQGERAVHKAALENALTNLTADNWQGWQDNAYEVNYQTESIAKDYDDTAQIADTNATELSSLTEVEADAAKDFNSLRDSIAGTDNDTVLAITQPKQALVRPKIAAKPKKLTLQDLFGDKLE